jgi:hypothetical protein
LKTALLTLTVIAAFAASGCNSKPKIEAPTKTDAAAQLPAGHPAPAGQQPPAGHPPVAAAPAGADPHANMKPVEIKPGEGKKAKVTQVLDTPNLPYTYLEVAGAKGEKLWLVAPKMSVKAGDSIEYPEAPVMPNFFSKSLNKTFDKLSMVPGIRVVK